MSLDEDHVRRASATDAPSERPLLRLVKAAVVRLGERILSRADHYAAAKLYGALSRLSDAELKRRGLNRTTSAHGLVRNREIAAAGTSQAPAAIDRERAACEGQA
jgi:hypothetical protein